MSTRSKGKSQFLLEKRHKRCCPDGRCKVRGHRCIILQSMCRLTILLVGFCQDTCSLLVHHHEFDKICCHHDCSVHGITESIHGGWFVWNNLVCPGQSGLSGTIKICCKLVPYQIGATFQLDIRQYLPSSSGHDSKNGNKPSAPLLIV